MFSYILLGIMYSHLWFISLHGVSVVKIVSSVVSSLYSKLVAPWSSNVDISLFSDSTSVDSEMSILAKLLNSFISFYLLIL